MSGRSRPAYNRPLFAARTLRWQRSAWSEYVLQEGLDHLGTIRLKFWRGATAEVLGEKFRIRHSRGRILLSPPESDLELASLPARRTLTQLDLKLAGGQVYTIQSTRSGFSDLSPQCGIYDAEKQPLVVFPPMGSSSTRETWLQVYSRATNQIGRAHV